MGKHSKKNHDPDYKAKQEAARGLARRVFIHKPKSEEGRRHTAGKVLAFSKGRYEVQTSGALKRL